MCRVRAKVKGGAIKGEKVAFIKAAEGRIVEVSIASSQAGKGYVQAFEVSRDKDKVLVELPRESATGDWRMWVDKHEILAVS